MMGNLCANNIPWKKLLKAPANQMLMELDLAIPEKLVQAIHNGDRIKGFMANSGVGEVLHAMLKNCMWNQTLLS